MAGGEEGRAPDPERAVRPAPGAATGSWHERSRWVIGIVPLLVLPIAIIPAFPAHFYVVLDTTAYLALHNVTEFFAIATALAIFAVAWFTYEQTKDQHALLLGCVFVGVGLVDLMHTLGYAGMPAFFTPNSAGKSTQFWIAARVSSAAAFLGSACVTPASRARWRSRRSLLACVLAFAALVFTSVTFFPGALPATFVPGVGLTPFKRGAEYLAVLLFALAAAAYWRRAARSGDSVPALYAVAFAICGLSELLFAGYQSVFDTYNVVGHVYKAMAFGIVFRAGFVASVQRPHKEVLEKERALRWEAAERQRTEDQLRQSQKLEAVGRLAGGVAHDFNNLLTVILGGCQLLARTLPKDGRHANDLKAIDAAAHRAAVLTRQLLALSRRQVIQPKVLDVDEVVRGMSQLLPRLIGEDVELVTALAASHGCVRADPGQLEQVIVNLAVNARDAMPGGGRLAIETSSVVLGPGSSGVWRGVELGEGPYVSLAVRDSGSGMTDEIKAHLFEPFFTTKEIGKGTGLGLSTVNGIVKQAGGGIRVRSAPGMGSRFEVLLPRVEEVPEPAVAPTAARTVCGTEAVLVVEDDPAVRRLTAAVLQEAGFSVLAAGNGKEAFTRAAHAATIDLLVTDVVMPAMGGIELAERLQRERPALRVLLMTGYADQRVDRACADRRFALQPKPFTPDVLLQRVRELLDRPDCGVPEVVPVQAVGPTLRA